MKKQNHINRSIFFSISAIENAVQRQPLTSHRLAAKRNKKPFKKIKNYLPLRLSTTLISLEGNCDIPVTCHLEAH